MSEDERRREARLDVRLDVDYRADETFLYAQARDISTMGIFLKATDPPKVGEIIELRFKVSTDGGHDVVVKGEVMWRKRDHDGGHPGCGVKFLDVDPQTRTRIIDLVDALTLVGPPPDSRPPG